jgi:hypothetical protein
MPDNSSPGWYFSQVPSTNQWNASYAVKVDASNGYAANLLVDGLLLDHDPLGPMEAVTRQYVDSHGGGGAGGAGVTIGDLPPASPSIGQLWFDGVGSQLYLYYDDPDSSQWVPVVNQSSNLASGGYLQLAGGSMTGALVLAADPTTALEAATKHYVDTSASAAGVPEAPTDGQDYTRRGSDASWQVAGTGVTLWNNRTGAVTLLLTDVTGVGGAPLASPTFTGTVASPTPTAGDASTTVATTAFVGGAITTAVTGKYLPIAGGQLSAPGNLGVGIAIPADAGPHQAFGDTADFGNHAIFAYTDTTAAWRRSSATQIPAILSTNGTQVVIYNAGLGAVDSTFTPLGVLTVDTAGILQCGGIGGATPVNTTGSIQGGPIASNNGRMMSNGPGSTIASMGVWSASVGAGGLWYDAANHLNVGALSGAGVPGVSWGYWDPNAGGTYYCGGTGISFVNFTGGGQHTSAFQWSSPNASVVNCSIDNGAAIQGFQPVSDARMKTNIADSTLDCLAMVGQLQIREFDWLDHADLDTPLAERQALPDSHEPVGLIAQEVFDLFPSGVQAGDTTTDTIGVMWNLKANSMLALLIGAVQALTARLEVLEQASA